MTLRSINSRLKIAGHPVHPVLVHFPVAALLGLIGTDVAYWLTGDFFWARAGLWLAGVGVVGGSIASIAGLIDLITVSRIRRLITGWCHAILAVMMLSLACLNWLLRLNEPSADIIPLGLAISVLTGTLIIAAAALGGQLVYEYGVGVDLEEALTRKTRP